MSGVERWRARVSGASEPFDQDQFSLGRALAQGEGRGVFVRVIPGAGALHRREFHDHEARLRSYELLMEGVRQPEIAPAN